jgi:pyrimidine operon attenuation protein/uracil phosphoribosyltransferase
MEDSMTIRIRTRQATAPPYYLGRPAAVWLAIFEPRSANRKPPHASRAGKNIPLGSE